MSQASNPINSFRADPSGWVGAAVMACFAFYASWRFGQTGLIFFLLLIARDLAAVWFLLVRRHSQGARRLDWLAYCSSALPLFYLEPANQAPIVVLISSALSIVGFALGTVALFELGTSFGIGAAARGRVRSGIYRYISHPMYAGYALSELGMVLLNPLNGVLYALSFLLYWRRARVETGLLQALQDPMQPVGQAL